MSSTCVLPPPAAANHHNRNTSSLSSPLPSSSLPTIHPALRPSTMQQQQHQQQYHDSGSMDSYQSANELLHDTVTLLSGSKGPTRVILSVFRTTADHFALVYPDNRRKAVAIKPAGCINLRSVTCEETTLGAGLKGFTLRPKKCDTSSAALTFICSDASLLPRWMEALSSPSDHISSLSTSSSSCTTNTTASSRNGGGGGGGGSGSGLKRSTATHFTPGPIEEPVCYRRTSPRLSSLSSLDEEDEEYDE